MQFVLQEAFRARKAYCGYLIWPISLWRSLNSPLRISCSWEREHLKKVFHCNQRWLKAFWQCRQKFLFRAAAGWVVREGGLEGARGFQEMGMRMLGSVRRTPVGKCEISKVLETTSVKQAQEISQTTVEKIWRWLSLFFGRCVFQEEVTGPGSLKLKLYGLEMEKKSHGFQRGNGSDETFERRLSGGQEGFERHG